MMNPTFGVRFTQQERILLKEVSNSLHRKQGDTLRYLLIEAHSNLRKVEDNGKNDNTNYLAAAER